MSISRFPFFYPTPYYNRYPYYRKPYTSNFLNKKNTTLDSTTSIYNNSKYPDYIKQINPASFNVQKSDRNSNDYNHDSYTDSVDTDKKNNSKSSIESDSYFFELFGLKLYFDDILLICLIFFLYQEGVKDDELFISLILLLLS